eukprot:1152901-Pelagomonas_calceolata.AAC.5
MLSPEVTSLLERQRVDLGVSALKNNMLFILHSILGITKDGKTVLGAGVYHPISDSRNLVEPNGAGITNTKGRAEVAAIAAALTNDYTHIAIDSLSSLHQLRKQILYPEKHRHLVQGDVL